MPLLKNKMRLIFLWFKISFLSENQNWVCQTLIYMIAFGWFLSWVNCLEKIIHNRWLDVPMILSPSLDIKFEMIHMKDHKDSWMKIISNSFLFSRIMSVSSLFFQTFCTKSFRFLKIMNLSCLQISKLICFYSHKALDISLSAILCWIGTSRKSMHYCWLDVLLYSLCTWSCVDTVLLFLFQVLVG